MKADLINLSDYIYTGEGANGESFNNKNDETIMLKLYYERFELDNIIHEIEQAQKVYDAGIPTPKPGKLVTDGNGRYGILFQRIVNKKSFARLCGENPENVEQYAREFGKMCKELHSVHFKEGYFDNEKEKELKRLQKNPYFTEEEREKVKHFIENIPDADTAIHGDLHFGNAITTGNEHFFIDIGDFSMGHPYLDLGMVLLTCMYEDDEFLTTQFHTDKKTAAQFWKYFVKEYFGENESPEKWHDILLPFAGLKVLLIELYAGTYFPQYHKLLEGITK